MKFPDAYRRPEIFRIFGIITTLLFVGKFFLTGGDSFLQTALPTLSLRRGNHAVADAHPTLALGGRNMVDAVAHLGHFDVIV